MSIHFYKLQTGGNGFVLIDTEERQNVPFFPRNLGQISHTAIERFSVAAVRLCSKRYGIGASGALFLCGSSLFVFDMRGRLCGFAADAYLCAARYIFDSGKANGKTIEFVADPNKPEKLQTLHILGSHDFRLSMGSPFFMDTGAVILPSTSTLMQTLSIDKTPTSAAAIHIQEDVITLFSSTAPVMPLRQLSYLFFTAYPDKNITTAIVRNIHHDSTVVHCTTGGLSSSCAAAASAVIATVLSGSALDNQIVYFEDKPGSVMVPTDNNGTTGRRIAVQWDKKDNTIYITGSGSYVFDGNIDIPEFSIPHT